MKKSIGNKGKITQKNPFFKELNFANFKNMVLSKATKIKRKENQGN